MLKFRFSRQDVATVDIRFEPESGLISFVCEGLVSEEDLHRAQSEAETLANGRPVRAMIIDVQRSSPGYAPDRLIGPLSGVLEELQIRRCAFVTPRGRDDILAIIETVAFPFAVRVRAFEDAGQARDWVLG